MMAVETQVEPPVAVEPERPSGPAAAVILATGIGSLVLGVLTTLNEASTDVHDWLEWNDRVGPLSGKSTLGAAGFLVSWAVLTALWRRSNPPLRTVALVTILLVALGFVGTFPTFFQAFASD
jgi:hypothetical protein